MKGVESKRELNSKTEHKRKTAYDASLNIRIRPNYPKLLSYQSLMRLSPAKREKYLEGVQSLMKDVARSSRNNRTGLFTEAPPQVPSWQFALIELLLEKSEAVAAFQKMPQLKSDATGHNSGGIINDYRPIDGGPERIQTVLDMNSAEMPWSDESLGISKSNKKNADGKGGAPPAPQAPANAPQTICQPPAILYAGRCVILNQPAAPQPKAAASAPSKTNAGTVVRRSLRPQTRGDREVKASGSATTRGSGNPNMRSATRPESQGPLDSQPLDSQPLETSMPVDDISISDPEVAAGDAAPVAPTSAGSCQAVTYQCLPRDSEEFQTIRRDFYDPKKDYAAKCVFTGNFSTYQDGVRAAGRCLPPKDFCFNRKDPSSCRSQTGDRMACDGRREAICNPLVFGLQQNGKPFCVDSGNGATAACDAASTPESRSYDFLNQDMSGIQEAWNQFRREFDTLCAGNPVADSNASRPAANHVFVLNCNECNLISVRLGELNEMAGAPCSGEAEPTPASAPAPASDKGAPRKQKPNGRSDILI